MIPHHIEKLTGFNVEYKLVLQTRSMLCKVINLNSMSINVGMCLLGWDKKPKEQRKHPNSVLTILLSRFKELPGTVAMDSDCANLNESIVKLEIIQRQLLPPWKELTFIKDYRRQKSILYVLISDMKCKHRRSFSEDWLTRLTDIGMIQNVFHQSQHHRTMSLNTPNGFT